jgi:hypothetical protein
MPRRVRRTPRRRRNNRGNADRCCRSRECRWDLASRQSTAMLSRRILPFSRTPYTLAEPFATFRNHVSSKKSSGGLWASVDVAEDEVSPREIDNFEVLDDAIDRDNIAARRITEGKLPLVVNVIANDATVTTVNYLLSSLLAGTASADLLETPSSVHSRAPVSGRSNALGRVSFLPAAPFTTPACLCTTHETASPSASVSFITSRL